MTPPTWKKSKMSFLRPKNLTSYGLLPRPSWPVCPTLSSTLKSRVPSSSPGFCASCFLWDMQWLHTRWDNTTCRCKDHSFLRTELSLWSVFTTHLSALLCEYLHGISHGGTGFDFAEGLSVQKFRRCSKQALAQPHSPSPSYHLWFTGWVRFFLIWSKEIPITTEFSTFSYTPLQTSCEVSWQFLNGPKSEDCALFPFLAEASALRKFQEIYQIIAQLLTILLW